MMRVLRICVVLVALTLVPTTGSVVAFASTSATQDPNLPPDQTTGLGGGGGDVFEAQGDPEDVIDGNRQDPSTIGLGGSDDEGLPLDVEEWELFLLLLNASAAVPY